MLCNVRPSDEVCSCLPICQMKVHLHLVLFSPLSVSSMIRVEWMWFVTFKDLIAGKEKQLLQRAERKTVNYQSTCWRLTSSTPWKGTHSLHTRGLFVEYKDGGQSNLHGFLFLLSAVLCRKPRSLQLQQPLWHVIPLHVNLLVQSRLW